MWIVWVCKGGIKEGVIGVNLIRMEFNSTHRTRNTFFEIINA